jgi:hypothetical protein
VTTHERELRLRVAPNVSVPKPGVRPSARSGRPDAGPLIEAARVAAALIGVAAVTALVVDLFAAQEARHFLGFTFAGVPRRWSKSVSIFAGNARVLMGVLVASAIVHLARRSTNTAPERILARTVTVVCDTALAAETGFNVLLVGAAFGAYGRRGLDAMLPHGPLELTAYSLALSAYLAARRGTLTRRRLIGTAAVGLAALAVGSVLEVFAR